MKKEKIFSVYHIIGIIIITAIVSCNSNDSMTKSEETSFKEVITENSIKTCEEFLITYPNSSYVPKVEKLKHKLLTQSIQNYRIEGLKLGDTVSRINDIFKQVKYYKVGKGIDAVWSNKAHAVVKLPDNTKLDIHHTAKWLTSLTKELIYRIHLQQYISKSKTNYSALKKQKLASFTNILGKPTDIEEGVFNENDYCRTLALKVPKNVLTVLYIWGKIDKTKSLKFYNNIIDNQIIFMSISELTNYFEVNVIAVDFEIFLNQVAK